MDDFKGRVVAGSGIGEAMAEAFALEGSKIVLADVALCRRTLDHFGAVRIVCDNAGVGVFGPTAEPTGSG